MDNTMKVGKTAEQRQLTKEAFMVHSYGGKIECEVSPNVWTVIRQPLDFERAMKSDDIMDDLKSLDFSELTHNFRPAFPK